MSSNPIITKGERRTDIVPEHLMEDEQEFMEFRVQCSSAHKPYTLVAAGRPGQDDIDMHCPVCFRIRHPKRNPLLPNEQDEVRSRFTDNRRQRDIARTQGRFTRSAYLEGASDEDRWVEKRFSSPQRGRAFEELSENPEDRRFIEADLSSALDTVTQAVENIRGIIGRMQKGEARHQLIMAGNEILQSRYYIKEALSYL